MPTYLRVPSMIIVGFQLYYTPPSFRMTEEEKQEAKDQLKALHQAYSDISQQCSDAQTPSTDKAKVLDAPQLQKRKNSSPCEKCTAVPDCMTNRISTAWYGIFRCHHFAQSPNHIPAIKVPKLCECAWIGCSIGVSSVDT